MAEQKQRLQRRQQTYRASMEERQQEILRQDKETIAKYQQHPGQMFQILPDQSMVRNYRNYEIYQNLQEQANQPYGIYQGVADAVVNTDLTYRDIHKRKLLLASDADGKAGLSVRDAILHLCSSSLVEAGISECTMKDTMNHLVAGQLWENGENPNAQLQREMNLAGREALTEIYFRHLCALDKTYGDKLATMTPSDYLRQMPQLEYDLQIVADMQVFFRHYQPAQRQKDPERFALMEKKLRFYGGVWSVLKERAQTYITMDEEKVTDEGELKKSVAKDFQKQLRVLRDNAKKEKAFQAWKQPLPQLGDLFAPAQARRQQALACLNDYGELRNQEMINGEEVQEITRLQERRTLYNNYLQYKEFLEHGRYENAKTRNSHQQFVDSYMKRKDAIKTPEEFEQLQQRLELLLRNQQDDEMQQFTPENALEFLEKLEQQIKECTRFLETSSDEDLMNQYGIRCTQFDRVLRLDRVLFSDEAGCKKTVKKALELHRAGKQPLDAGTLKKYEDIEAALLQHQEFDKAYSYFFKAGQRRMEQRLEEIVRYGCSQGRNLTDEEDTLEWAKKVSQAVRSDEREEQEAPMTFARAIRYGQNKKDAQGKQLGIPVNDDFAGTLQEGRLLQFPKLVEQIRAMKRIRETKEKYPQMYWQGQSYEDLLHCEKMLRRLPAAERFLELTLRINHLDRYGNAVEDAADMQDLRQQYEQTRQECVRQYRISEKDWKCQLEEELAGGLHLLREKKAYLGKDATPAITGAAAELLESVDLVNALSFVELPAQWQRLLDEEFSAEALSEDRLGELRQKRSEEQGTPQEQETILRDLGYINCVVQITETDEVSTERMEAARSLLVRFHRSYADIMQQLDAENHYPPYCLVRQRASLEQCNLMANFLRAHLTANGFDKKLMAAFKQAGNEADVLMVKDLPQKLERIYYFAMEAQRLAMASAVEDGLTQMSYVSVNGVEVRLSNASEIKDSIFAYEMSLGDQMLKLRKASIEEKHARELWELEMRNRVDQAVGRELLASAKHGETAVYGSASEKWGHRLGSVLQLLAWWNRDKRVMHGECNYGDARLLYQKKLGQLEGSVLDNWQRGDAGLSPKIELKKYYHSPMKEAIRGMTEAVKGAEGDYLVQDTDFARAIEAMQMYTGIEGIVNLDTTEMELTFLDTFLNHADRFVENHEADHEPKTERSRQLLRDIRGQLNVNLHGTLASTVSAEEFQLICDRTIAYAEDTTIMPNLKKSNIEHIPLFTHEPNINDIKQSVIGDCWFVSAISSVVNTNPDFVRSMFQDLGDGNVIVRLFAAVDAHGEPIKSAANIHDPGVRMQPAYFKLRKDYETGWGNACDCPWMQLLEKAYALGGFNYTHEMEVRGNRLYNVAYEMTLGGVDSGIAHLTGHIPRKENTMSHGRHSILREEVFEGLTAGMTEIEVNAMKTVSALFEGDYNARGKEGKAVYTYDAYFDLMREEENICPLAMEWRKRNHTESDAELTEEEKAAAYTFYRELVEANLSRMKRGEPLPFTQAQHALREKEQIIPANGAESPLEWRKLLTRYYGQARSPLYSLDVMRMVYKFKDCIEQGGTVSVSIPHFVNVIDVREDNGRWFILMRDPFNIYNTVYTQENGVYQTRSEGLSEVYTKRNENRHLADTKEAVVLGGFRGTSWIEANHFYEQIHYVCQVPRSFTQIPHYE